MKTIIFKNRFFQVLISYLYSKITNKIYLGIFSPLQMIERNENLDVDGQDVLVETIMSGYCGSDKAILSYNMSLNSSAFVDTTRHKERDIYFGHETVGKVIKIGNKVDSLSVGDHVILDSVDKNVKGRIYPENYKKKYGGWSTHFLRHEFQLVKISPTLDFEKAIFIEPLCCCYGAIKKANVKENENVLIVGAGTIGQGLLVLLRHLFKERINITIATNTLSHKNLIDKNLIENIIFDEDIFNASKKILKTKIKKYFFNQILEKGYDKIFDCTSDAKLLNKLLRVCNNGGTIVITGMNMNLSTIDPTPIWHREIDVVGTHAYSENYPELKDKTLKYMESLIVNKEINIDNFKVNKIKINDWKKMFTPDEFSIKNAITFL